MMEYKVLLVVLVVAAFAYGVLSRLVMVIPFRLEVSWLRDIGQFDESYIGSENDVDDEKFKVGVGFKVSLALVVSAITTAVLLKGGISVETIGMVIFFMGVVTLAGININHLLLPDMLVMPFIWAGLLFHSYLGHNLESYVYGCVAAYLIPYIIYLVIKVITGKESIGYGDFKMFAMLGAWFGISQVSTLVVVIFAMVVLGTIVGVFFRSNKPTSTGGYYLVASLVVYFYGSII